MSAADDLRHYVLVCGGRDFDDYQRVRDPVRLLHGLYGDRLRLMHGGARGADALGQRAADEFGIVSKTFPADWDQHGKAAGAIRNEQMAVYLLMCHARGHSVQVLATPGGNGTAHMVREAERRGIPVDHI